MNTQVLDDARYEIRGNSGDVGIRVAYAYLYVFKNGKLEIRFIKDISGLSSREEAILFSKATIVELSQNGNEEEIFTKIKSGSLKGQFFSMNIQKNPFLAGR